MTGRLRDPDPWAVVAKLNRRVDTLERRLNRLEQQFKPEMVFYYDGPLAVAASGVWRRRETGRLVAATGSLLTAGSTATEVTVYKNGDSIGVLVIQAGQTFGQLPLSVRFAPDVDTLQDQITTAGTGAASLTVQHRWAASTS